MKELSLIKKYKETDPLILKEELQNKQKYKLTSGGVFIDLGDKSFEKIINIAYKRTKNERITIN